LLSVLAATPSRQWRWQARSLRHPTRLVAPADFRVLAAERDVEFHPPPFDAVKLLHEPEAQRSRPNTYTQLFVDKYRCYVAHLDKRAVIEQNFAD
jgi:hypothetical protein